MHSRVGSERRTTRESRTQQAVMPRPSLPPISEGFDPLARLVRTKRSQAKGHQPARARRVVSTVRGRRMRRRGFGQRAMILAACSCEKFDSANEPVGAFSISENDLLFIFLFEAHSPDCGIRLSLFVWRAKGHPTVVRARPQTRTIPSSEYVNSGSLCRPVM